MGNAICKLWTFLLNLIQKAVEAVSYALKTVGEVVIPLLGQLGEVVSDTLGGLVGNIFGGSNLLVWAGAGIFAYFLLTKEDKNGSGSVIGNYAKTVGPSTGVRSYGIGDEPEQIISTPAGPVIFNEDGTIDV